MGYDNNNAGMHMIRWYQNYDNLRYYDLLAEKKDEERERRKAEEKMDLEYRQRYAKAVFDQQVRDVRRIGVSIIDILYTNVAYIAYKEDKDLVSDIDDIDSFIEKYVKEYEKSSALEQSMFYVGLLAWRLGVSANELYVDNDEMIKHYFMDIIDEALVKGNYKRNTYLLGKYIEIDDNYDSELYFYKDDKTGKYCIDVKFPRISDLELSNDEKMKMKHGFPDYFNVVNEDSLELEQLYNRIQFYYFFSEKQNENTKYHEFYMGDIDDKSIKNEKSIFISDEDLRAHEGFMNALVKAIPEFDLHSSVDITEDDWKRVLDNIPLEDKLSLSLYTEAGVWIWKYTMPGKFVKYIGI